MFVDILIWIFRVLAILGAVYGLWNFLVSISSFGRLNPVKRNTEIHHRFAVVTCAKNESAVIGQLIASLHRQSYPAEYFRIFVTADNCDDDTAEVCRQAGATVFERFDPEHRGKGYALGWFFDRFLPQHRDDFDAVVVFDADNVVHRDFLRAMNDQLCAGHALAAGSRVGKNPSSSITAGLSSMFWLLQSRYFYHPRARRGLPACSVGGTGFMFRLDLLGEKGWDTHSITEDIEFTLTAISQGHFAAYSPEAVFYDEQPLTFWQSVTQRYRWAVGALECMPLCTPQLWAAYRAGNRKVFDSLVFSMGIFVASLSGVFWIVGSVLEAAVSGNWTGLLWYLGTMAVLAYVFIAFFAWLALELEDKSWIGDWGSILLFPFFALSWSLINSFALFWRDSTWHDIPHTVNWTIEDVEHSVRIRQPDVIGGVGAPDSAAEPPATPGSGSSPA